tara:strand:+ start:337 stop:891 length:555 start_codon:yes stop_codon:yes gene_type:complete
MQYNGNLKTNEHIIDDKLREKIFIGIDPGKNGGVAVLNEIMDGDPVICFRCPKNPRDMAFSLMSTIPTNVPYDDVIVLIEFVHAMPMNGVVSMFSFGQNLGQWEGILGSLELDPIYAGPRTWMSHYDCKPRMDKKDRKRYLRGIAEELFPNIKMTFNISDALLIANYNKETYYKKLAANARQKS